tara:strand:+ start:1991 stop:2149 length:159 start_codon:yes stop_codon:yes gene_type:complete
MKEIDILLERWIPVNTIIREEIRTAIVKECLKQYNLGVEAGLDYKINTNTNR